MYSRQEVSQVNQEFWTSFGLYMSPVPSAEGSKINWVNYKTGVKHVRLKLWAENKSVGLMMIFANPDERIQVKWKILLTEIAVNFLQVHQAQFQVDGLQVNEDEPVFRVRAEQTGLDVMNKADWPAIISFLKTQLVQIDEFWCENRELFEMMA